MLPQHYEITDGVNAPCALWKVTSGGVLTPHYRVLICEGSHAHCSEIKGNRERIDGMDVSI